jgi:hypothetical protein
MKNLDKVKYEMFKKQLSIIGRVIENQIIDLSKRDKVSVEVINFKYFFLTGNINGLWMMHDWFESESEYFDYIKNEIDKAYMLSDFEECIDNYKITLKRLLDDILEKMEKIEIDMLWKEDVEYCESNFLI